MYSHLLIILAAFILVWFSAGLVVDTIASMARRLNLTPFSFSFFFLGLFTSITELMIGLNALSEREPTIFVGNLLGGTVVLFGFVLPLLALLTGGIRFKKELSTTQLGLTLLYICLPAIAIADGKVTISEALVTLAGYPLIWLLIKIRKQSVLQSMFNQLTHKRFSMPNKAWQMFAGVAMLVVASHLLVQQTLWLSNTFQTTPFLISLLILSIGSNLPELVVAFQAALKGKTEVAYGSYLGSAVANTFFFGLLTLLHRQTIFVYDGLSLLFPSILLLSVLFYFFLRSEKGLSRVEGFTLLLVYAAYLTGEWLVGR